MAALPPADFGGIPEYAGGQMGADWGQEWPEGPTPAAAVPSPGGFSGTDDFADGLNES